MSIEKRKRSKLVGWLLAMFTIPKCASCRKRIKGREVLLCRDCERRYLTEKAKYCTDCGFPHSLCRCSLQTGGRIFRVIHMGPYDPKNYGVVSRVVFNAKDKYFIENFAFMAEQCAKALEDNEITPEKDWVITWIPRRKKAIRKIGHDQSKVIARLLAKSYGMKLTRVFKNTGVQPQKRQGFDQRVQNAFSSYEVTGRGEKKIYAKTVIIVDDLATTGATQHVAISLALEAGADDVVPLCFAKTDRGYKRYKGKNK